MKIGSSFNKETGASKSAWRAFQEEGRSVAKALSQNEVEPVTR